MDYDFMETDDVVGFFRFDPIELYNQVGPPINAHIYVHSHPCTYTHASSLTMK